MEEFVPRDSTHLGTDRIFTSPTAQALYDNTLLAMGILGTPQATTSGTAFDLTDVASWVKQITVMLAGVSLSGTDDLLVQIGDSGGIETSGYVGTTGSFSSAGQLVAALSIGFSIIASGAGATINGSMILTLVDEDTFTWSCQGSFGNPGDSTAKVVGGYRTLNSALTSVRLTRTGTDTFDAGKVNFLCA